MSRCFPFPPRGYESKARSDHVDLLAKEKRKEKKHKKEKKDREKREGKERKDKDRSKERHTEEKDGKEKHRDKKKDRDKGKNRTSEDGRIEERIEGHHEVNLGDSSKGAQEVEDSKFTEEMGRRIRDEEKGATNSMAENFTGSIQRTKGMGAAAAMEKGRVTGTEMSPNSIGGTSERRHVGMGRPVDSFAVQIQRIEGVGSATAMEKERCTSNNMDTNLTGTEKRRNHGVACTTDNPIGSLQEGFEGRCIATTGKERGANKFSNTIGTVVPNHIATEQRRNHAMGRPVDNILPRKAEGICTGTAIEGKNNNMVSYPIDTMQGRNDGVPRPAENLTPSIPTATEKERGKGSQMVAILIGTEQRRNDGIGGSVGNDKDNSMEGKEKTRDREADDCKGDRHGDRDRNEKKNKGKDKNRHKEKEKEKEKTREKGEDNHKKENDKPRDNGKKDLVDSLKFNPLVPHKDNANSAVIDGNINKRKEFKLNGCLHEYDSRPKKFPRTSSSPHLPLENGRTLESCHLATPVISPGATDNTTAGLPDNKEHKINGIRKSRPSSVNLRPPFPLDNSENKVCLKPAHPDSKYLNQIYSVPKMEEWPEFDDQDWLLSTDDVRPKPKAKFEDVETPQVWAEAMQIESADVMALPYVTPF